MAPRTLVVAAFVSLVGVQAAAGQRPTDPQVVHADACASGELRSCSVLGLIYETGAGGVRDVGRALELYERACAREVAAACLRLDLAREAAPPLPPDDPHVRIGRVADFDTGAPVANALVELPGLDIRMVADLHGRVDLGRLPEGRHRISARRAGYDGVAGALPVPWEGEFLLLLHPNAATEAVEETRGRVLGQVVDADTGAPLPNVAITLVGPDSVRTLTNADGRFSFADVQPGAAEVRLRLLGYEERTRELQVEAGRTVEVQASLASAAIELEPIEVTVGSAYLERAGFYGRAARGAGYHLTRRNFAAMDPLRLSEVFRLVPGVQVEHTRQGAFVVTNRERGRDRPGACRLRTYIDSMPAIDLDIDAVRPDDVEAIEVHQGLSAPVEYRNLRNPDGTYPCGVVLIWTTRGR